MNDTSTQARYIADKFGGASALARALGHRHVTTVQHWLIRGYIPMWRRQEILAAAQEAGVDLTPEDFVRDLNSQPAAE